MNLIEHLTRTVTPILLGHHTDTEGNYTALLERVYAIFIARLADKDTYQTFGDTSIDNEDSSFLERLIPDGNHRAGMVQELSQKYNIEEQDTQILINRSAPLVFNELRGLAGTSTLPAFLSNNISSVASFIPTWAYAFIPAGILSALNLGSGASVLDKAENLVHNAVDSVSDTVSSVTHNVGDAVSSVTNNVGDAVSAVGSNVSQAVHSATETVNENAGGLGKVLLPLIALLIIGGLIAMMLKSCNTTQSTQGSTAPVASVASATGSTGSLSLPTFKFATDANGNVVAGGMGEVGNDDLKGKILGALTGVFGADADKALNLNINPAFDVNLPFADKLGDIFKLVKAVPNASFNYMDGHIMVSAPDEALANKLVADIKALVPDTTVMLESEHGHHHDHAHGHSHDNATASTTADNQTVSANSANEASVDFTDGRLNFYFATGKADVAQNALEHAKAILDEAKAGKKLGISGYTDSTGNAEANAKLSKKRAEAVKQFLVANGVAETQLELIKPKDSVGATGKDQEGRRVEVYILDETAPASTAN